MDVWIPALQEILKLSASAALGYLTLKITQWGQKRRAAPVHMSEFVERQIQRVIEEKDEHYTRREAEWREMVAELKAEIARRSEHEREMAVQLARLIDRLKNGGSHTQSDKP